MLRSAAEEAQNRPSSASVCHQVRVGTPASVMLEPDRKNDENKSLASVPRRSGLRSVKIVCLFGIARASNGPGFPDPEYALLVES
jgi:hypothetical protein